MLLLATQDFKFERRDGREWRCPTLAYTYTLYEGSRRELIAWHWRLSSSHGPHAHVRADVPDLGGSIRKLHLPTGRVAFENIVEFLIRDLGVEPAQGDWEQRILDAESYFRRYRSWPGPHPAPVEQKTT